MSKEEHKTIQGVFEIKGKSILEKLLEVKENIEEKIEECPYFKEYMHEQKRIIERNLKYHKIYNHIDDPKEAALDFVDQHAGIMREIYCDLCNLSKNCKVYEQHFNQIEHKLKNYIKKNGEKK